MLCEGQHDMNTIAPATPVTMTGGGKTQHSKGDFLAGYPDSDKVSCCIVSDHGVNSFKINGLIS